MVGSKSNANGIIFDSCLNPVCCKLLVNSSMLIAIGLFAISGYSGGASGRCFGLF